MFVCGLFAHRYCRSAANGRGSAGTERFIRCNGGLAADPSINLRRYRPLGASSRELESVGVRATVSDQRHTQQLHSAVRRTATACRVRCSAFRPREARRVGAARLLRPQELSTRLRLGVSFVFDHKHQLASRLRLTVDLTQPRGSANPDLAGDLEKHAIAARVQRLVGLRSISPSLSMRVKQPQQIFVVRWVLEKQKDALFSIRLKNQTIEEESALDVDGLNRLSIDLMI